MRNGASQLQRSTGLLVTGHCCPQDEILLPDAREWSTDYDCQEHCANELRTAKEKNLREYSGSPRFVCKR